MLNKIKNINYRLLLVIVILAYVLSGLLESVFLNNENDFYSNLVSSPDSYQGKIMASGSFEQSTTEIESELISEFASCINIDGRTLTSWGELENDQHIFIQFESIKYIYQLSFRWIKPESFAFVTGYERRIDKENGKAIQLFTMKSLGGECIHLWLIKLQHKVKFVDE